MLQHVSKQRRAKRYRFSARRVLEGESTNSTLKITEFLLLFERLRERSERAALGGFFVFLFVCPAFLFP